MKKVKLLSLAAVGILALVGATSCTDPNPNPDVNGGGSVYTVKMGLQNNMGGACGTVAYVEGYFKDEGVSVSQQVLSGPNIASNLLQGSLDVGFLGNGVAWNYFTKDSKIKLIAIDNITDDDRLLANPNSEKAKNLPAADGKLDNYEQLADALAGASVLFNPTTTPATFFTSLVTEINTHLEEGEKIWWQSGTDKLPASGITTYSEDRKINVDNNITEQNMASALRGGTYDFAVAFSNAANTIQTTLNYKIVARTSSHLSTENIVPSTWAANVDFIENHPDEFAKWMKGLVRGMDRRHDNPDKTADAVVEVLNHTVEKSTIDLNPGYWPTREDQLDYIKEGGIAYTYVENIRNNHLSGENKAKVVKTAKEAADFSYLKTACEALA